MGLLSGVVAIPLTKGEFCVVDEADAEMVLQHRWYTNDRGLGYRYAIRTAPSGSEYLHRLIAGAERGEVVDHINGNTLDNRRDNLRVCTHQQNIFNCKCRPSKSGFKGVYLYHDKRRWAATITVGGKRTWLGLFDDPKEAARAYDAAAKERFGEYARLNNV